MKKTVSVNIKGLNFLIEEDAYELLQNYLERLKARLEDEIGGNDIVEDIELRIAELCSARLNESKTVIELTDIEQIIAALGNPEDYVEPEESEEFTKTQQGNNTHRGGEKRLFRDVENATIAGVCSGIANFLHIDVVIVRAIFVVLFLFGGFGFPLYLILWIIVPKAKNTIDRLRMKGRPITVETVREEVESAADNITKGSKRFAQKIRKDDHYSKSISRGARILSSIFGIGLLGIGVLMLVPFLIFTLGGFDVIPVQSDLGPLSLAEFGEFILNDNGDFFMVKLGVLLLGFSVILFFLLLGSMFLLQIKNRWSKLSLLFLSLTALTGFILCSIVGIHSAQDLIVGSELEKSVGSVYSNSLVVKAHVNEPQSKDGYRIKSHDEFGIIEVSGENITLYGIHFKYVPSPDSSFHVLRRLSARGKSGKAGEERAGNIEHEAYMSNDTLNLNTFYNFPAKDKLRDQEVTMIIQIPDKGKVVLNDRVIQLGAESEDQDLDERYLGEDGYLKSGGSYKHYD